MALGFPESDMSQPDPPRAEARQGMFCDVCGNYAIARRELQGETGRFVCAACGRQNERRVLPLLILTGASGSGKTTIIPALQRLLPECGVFDKDLMWARDWDMAYNNFFRIASALAQADRITVVVGTIIPEHLTGLSDRDLVGTIAYANLHCEPAIRRERLLRRRTWNVPDDDFVQRHQRFAAWLREHADSDFHPPMPTFDTSTAPPEDVAAGVAQWARRISATLRVAERPRA